MKRLVLNQQSQDAKEEKIFLILMVQDCLISLSNPKADTFPATPVAEFCSPKSGNSWIKGKQELYRWTNGPMDQWTNQHLVRSIALILF